MFFFFKQKTAYEMRISDWSSDVCSSDLIARKREPDISGRHHRVACSNAHVARERKRETGARRRPVDDRQRRLRHQVQQPYRLGMVHHRVDALFMALRTGIARGARPCVATRAKGSACPGHDNASDTDRKSTRLNSSP